jgi:phage baseplate assembly protein V
MDINRNRSGKDEAFKNLIRYGKISSVNPSLAMARVAFADKPDGSGNPMISQLLPIIVPGSLKNKHYHIPDVNEDVLCLFLPNGLQRGFILGSFYNVNNPPPVTSGDKEHVTFSDGTVVEYDRAAHALTVNVQGTVNVTATGGVNVTGNVNVTGTITASGNVTGGGISLDAHVHTGVTGGSGNTGGPTG